eukprot:m51a1_g5753 hypothetical protein (337) ;mRNA; r:1196024-1197363
MQLCEVPQLLVWLLALSAAVTLLAYFVPLALVSRLVRRPQNVRALYGARWALVTGGSSGLGLLFAKRLASQGTATLASCCPLLPALACASDQLLRKAQKELEDEFPERTFRCVAVDLSAPGYLDQLRAATADIDVQVVVSNAGCGGILALHATSEDSLEHFLTLNATSHAQIARHYYTLLVQKHLPGAIVFTSSAMAFIPMALSEPYCACKAFLESFARSLSMAAREHAVDVLAVLPGAVTGTRFYDPLPAVTALGPALVLSQPPHAVVDDALCALGRAGVATLDTGALSWLARCGSKVLGGDLMATIARRLLWSGAFPDYTALNARRAVAVAKKS